MASFEELEQKVGRFTDRLKSFQQERDQRSKLALNMLASIEHKVRSQQAALDKANTRIAQLEHERDTAISRVTEIIDLYESSLTNNDAFFRGIEQLANKMAGASATQPKPEAAAPRPAPAPPPPTQPPLRPSAAPQPAPQPPKPAAPPQQRPVTTLPPAPPPRTGVVQAPSKTPFLREMGPSQLQPRDRKDDGKS